MVYSLMSINNTITLASLNVTNWSRPIKVRVRNSMNKAKTIIIIIKAI